MCFGYTEQSVTITVTEEKQFVWFQVMIYYPLYFHIYEYMLGLCTHRPTSCNVDGQTMLHNVACVCMGPKGFNYDVNIDSVQPLL